VNGCHVAGKGPIRTLVPNLDSTTDGDPPPSAWFFLSIKMNEKRLGPGACHL